MAQATPLQVFNSIKRARVLAFCESIDEYHDFRLSLETGQTHSFALRERMKIMLPSYEWASFRDDSSRLATLPRSVIRCVRLK